MGQRLWFLRLTPGGKWNPCKGWRKYVWVDNPDGDADLNNSKVESLRFFFKDNLLYF